MYKVFCISFLFAVSYGCLFPSVICNFQNWNIVDVHAHVSFRQSAQWVDIYIHYEMIAMRSLVTVCPRMKILQYYWPYSLGCILYIIDLLHVFTLSLLCNWRLILQSPSPISPPQLSFCFFAVSLCLYWAASVWAAVSWTHLFKMVLLLLFVGLFTSGVSSVSDQC